ncbi:MAG: ATP-binding cassette domain-containing protein, partial [Bacilli bacterium]
GDRLKGLREILVFGAKKRTIDETDQASAALNEHSKRMKMHEGKVKMWTDVALYVTMGTHVLISVVLVTDGIVLAIDAIVGLAVLVSSFGPFLALSQLSASLTQTTASAKVVLNFLEQPTDELEQRAKSMDGVHAIYVENVTYGYDESQSLFQTETFTLSKGEIIALKGANGSGKSTFVSVLAGQLAPRSGEVRYERDSNVSTVAPPFAVMNPQTFIFTDTLRFNLTLGAHYTEQQLAIAIAAAGLTEFVARLEDGLDTHLDEQGANISTGQKQRIGLARVFLQNRTVQVFDEPTTNVDAENEAHILQSIVGQRSDKITIIVSHSPDVLAYATRTFEIKNGRLYECES